MIENEEIWIPIKGYEGLYSISDRKRIKSLSKLINRGKDNSLRMLKEKILTTNTGDVTLCKSGSRKTYDVNTLYEIHFNGYKNDGERKKVILDIGNVTKIISRRQLCQIIKYKKPNKTSKFSGVVKRKGVFTAAICINRRDIYLGTFLNDKDAYEMYKKAVKNTGLFLGNPKQFRNTLNSIK